MRSAGTAAEEILKGRSTRSGIYIGQTQSGMRLVSAWSATWSESALRFMDPL